MEYTEAKKRFIQAWGTMGANWGINKAMAQIHALLLVATEPLSADQIMQELKMSRGNVNMNLRELMDWGIVAKHLQTGERREYFTTGKDVWALAKQISKERRRREFEPLIKVLEEVRHVTGEDKKSVTEFRKVASDLHEFTGKLDGLLEKFGKSDQNWFYKLLMKL